MEECSEQGSSYSWWWDSHNNPHQSPWLCSTLSELDRKTKMIVNLIEQDGDSFAKRAEMYYERRPELIKMVEDLHKSYRSLAEKYDQLRSNSAELSPDNSSTPLSSFFEQAQHHPHITSTRCFEITKLAPTNSPDPINVQNVIGSRDANIDRVSDCEGRRIEMWDELRLRVSELIEDVSRQQAELIRRSDEKREKITSLQIHISMLMEENKALKDRLAMYTDAINQNQSAVSKMNGFFCGKSSQ